MGGKEEVGVGGRGAVRQPFLGGEARVLALCSHCFNQTGAASSWSGQLGLEQCERAPESGGGAAAR